MSVIRVMAIQVGWTPDREDNLRRALDLIEKGFQQYGQADIICLPEFFYESPTYKNRDTVGETLDGRFYQSLARCADKYRANMITGTFPLKKEGKLYNTCLAIDRGGNLVGQYDKVHLFDTKDRKESDCLTAGTELGIFDFDCCKVGVAVCYEVRFCEYLRTLALKDIDLLVIPAMFYRPRQDQWDLLVRSAALQQQLFVAAANQYNRYCFGRSQIVDPCGLPLSQASDREDVIFTCIDTEYQKQVRAELAVYENRVPAVYDIK